MCLPNLSPSGRAFYSFDEWIIEVHVDSVKGLPMVDEVVQLIPILTAFWCNIGVLFRFRSRGVVPDGTFSRMTFLFCLDLSRHGSCHYIMLYGLYFSRYKQNSDLCCGK
jgi:hypothetical protein